MSSVANSSTEIFKVMPVLLLAASLIYLSIKSTFLSNQILIIRICLALTMVILFGYIFTNSRDCEKGFSVIGEINIYNICILFSILIFITLLIVHTQATSTNTDAKGAPESTPSAIKYLLIGTAVLTSLGSILLIAYSAYSLKK